MRSDYFIATVTHRLLTLTHIMKSFIAILALAAVASADVVKSGYESDAVIVKQDADVFPDQYQYAYETSNGIQAQESGVLQNPGREDEAIAVQGSNSYTAPGGERISLTYTADTNGYQAQGAHLPVAPTIPEYIVRALNYIAANPQKPDPYQKA